MAKQLSKSLCGRACINKFRCSHRWHLGCVTETHPGDDGVARVVKLRTRTGELTRRVVKWNILPQAEYLIMLIALTRTMT